MAPKLIKKILIKTQMEVLTGLHIGGSKENVEIGGIDNIIVRTPLKDNQPYVPGSSLKGKMRCLLEQTRGKTLGKAEDVNNLFGYSQNNQPSKLIVRDAYLSQESVEKLKECEYLDLPYTEIKSENVIDRVKGTAEHPRQMERIPAGVTFDVEFIINVWNDDNKDDLLKLLKEGLKLLEYDYLGGSGSRGYGQVRFGELKVEEIDVNNLLKEEQK